MHTLQAGPKAFRASSFLGPWLRAVWQAHPQLQPQIASLAAQHAALAGWWPRLQAVCGAAGLPAPSDLQKLPMHGGQNLVFLVHDHYIKFFAEEVGGLAVRNAATCAGPFAVARPPPDRGDCALSG